MEQVLEQTHSMDRRGQETANSIAMLVLLVSLSMLFATLMLGYVFYRWTSDVWPPMGLPKVDIIYPSISTVIIILSSLSYHSFESSYSKGKELFKPTALLVTIVLAAAFLVSQLKLWTYMNQIGLYVEGGVFPSILHGFTWIHAGHLVVALLLLFYLSLVVIKSPFKIDRSMAIKNIGKVWHFLGLVWIIIYLTLFVL